jgi:hypothetical protein
MQTKNDAQAKQVHLATQSAQTEVDRVYISKADGCVRWGVGQTTLAALLRSGKIRSVKLGSRRLIEVRSGDLLFSSLPNSN